jgi:single-strand DNA-binding protein
MNLLTLAGFLGADPEVRYTSSGQKVTTFRLGVKARKSGGDDTIWWRVTCWGEQFDKIMSFLKKGSAVVVVGEMMKPEIFTNRDGQPQISMSMTASQLMFSPFGKSERRQGDGGQQDAKVDNVSTAVRVEEGAGFATGEQVQGQEVEIAEDEIPF